MVAASTIHTYLNNDFYNLIDAAIRSQIKQVKIPYRPGSGTSKTVNTGANGLSTKIFFLSGYEVGFTTATSSYFPVDGVRLSYFEDGTGTSALNKRIAKLNGSATHWWLRSPYLSRATLAWLVYSNGNVSNYGCTSTYGVRPAFILPSSLLVSDDGTVVTNTAPTMPASITVPEQVNGGSSITITWAASTDAEGNLAGYKVERSTDGGGSWTQIYQSSGTSCQDNISFGTETVQYRVKAYDTAGLESGWRTSVQRDVFNNTAPSAPDSITVPVTPVGGEKITISWSASTDAEGNLKGYRLERQVGSNGWEQIYEGAGTSYQDTITKGWATVTYRVKAYDAGGLESAYATSPTRTVDNNTAPTITCDSPSGSDLGEKTEGFTVSYSVSDPDGDAITVTEALDGVVRLYAGEIIAEKITLVASWRTRFLRFSGPRPCPGSRPLPRPYSEGF